MKKFIVSLVAEITGVILVGFLAVMVYNNLVETGKFFTAIWNWGTDHYFILFLVAAFTALSGIEIRRLGIKRYGRAQYNLLVPPNVVGNILSKVVAPIILFIDLFFFFNYLNLIQIFLIVLGGIIITALAFFSSNELIKKNEKSFLIFLTKLTISFTALGYFIDIFVFAWRPWIALSVLSLTIIIAAVFLLLEYIKKKRVNLSEKREKAITEENEKQFRACLLDLRPLHLALAYIEYKEKRDAANEKFATLHFETLYELVKSDHSLSADELAEICNKIRHTNYQLGRDFLDLIAKECLKKDAVELIFTSSSFSISKLPILFANCSKKKEVIESFLANLTIHESMQKLLFNNVKREFKTSILIGIINILEFAYEKNSDELVLKNLIGHIQSFLDFASDCILRIRKPEEATILKTNLISLFASLKQAGIDITEETKSV